MIDDRMTVALGEETIVAIFPHASSRMHCGPARAATWIEYTS